MLPMISLLNGVLLALTVVLSYQLFRQQFGDDAVALVGGLVTLLILRDTFTSVLSEVVFIPLVLAWLVSFERWLRRPTSRLLLFVALVAALACLTRYIGVTLIAAGVMCIILYTPRNWTRRAAMVGVYTLIGLAPLGLWLLRNYLTSGYLTGWRPGANQSLAENLVLSMDTVVQMSAPLALVMAVMWFRLNKVNIARMRALEIFVTVYLGWLHIQAARVAFDPIGARLLAPVIVPTLLLELVVLTRIARWFVALPRLPVIVRLARVICLRTLRRYT